MIALDGALMTIGGHEAILKHIASDAFPRETA
jgi:hypothetical protein